MIRYHNPVVPGFHPDPSVCRVGDDFYLVVSSFEYFPGVPVFHSRNLTDWRLIGHCIHRSSQLDLTRTRSSGGIYAPTIRYHDGRFYMVTTDVGGIGHFFVSATNPEGPWSDPITVDQGGIDPSLLFDKATVYFSSTGVEDGVQGIYQCEIDIETGRKTGPTRLIWNGTGGRYPEAPHLYRRGEYYYLMIAEGGTEREHSVTIARSRDPYGPFEPAPHNPILTHRGSWSPIASTGHAEIFDDPSGAWWIAFLAVRHVGYPAVHHLGRETYLAPVEWPENEWPVVNGGELIQLEMAISGRLAPAADTAADREEAQPGGQRPCDLPFEAEFGSGTLDPRWTFRRNPPPESWSLTERPGSLTLRCLPGTLSDTVPMSFLGIRQQHFRAHAEARIDFDPEAREEAGLAVVMNERYHSSLSIVSAREGGRAVVLRRRIGSVAVETGRVLIGSGPVRLSLQTEEEWYRFLVDTEAGTVEVGRAETRHHATELAGGFTGVFIALFASGNGTEATTRAYVDRFTYIPATGR